MRIRQTLEWGRKKLEYKTEPADLEAEVLFLGIIKKDKAWLYANMELELTRTQQKNFKKYIERRAKGEPVAYILGHKEFYGLRFEVNKNVLIPRPETEMMVSEIINNQSTVNKGDFIFIDVGTGSGCVPISIVKELKTENKKLKVIGIDISKKALAVAKKNAVKHGVGKKIEFIQGDLLKNIPYSILNIPYSKIIITANLPYLSNKMYQDNYKGLKFEPRQALVAKNNGLGLYEDLLKQTKELRLSLDGPIALLLEIDPRQAKDMKELIKKYLARAEVKIKKDLGGRKRLVVIGI